MTGNKLLRSMLGKRIREARQHSGLSHANLSYLLKIGVRLPYYWETGERMPNLETLCRLCVYCDVSLAWMLFDVDEKREEIARG